MNRAVLALAALSLCSTGPAHSAGRAPYEIVRDLERLQDRIAAGDTVAEVAHAKAIERTAKLFAAEPSAAWRDKRNARALIVYLFSGGSAPAIEDSIRKDSVPTDLSTLYAGALAYGMGDDAEARKTLLTIDARSEPSEVGAHLALVQATLCAQNDRDKAIALLDLARLLAPGTLVEEASLRKEMSLISATGRLDKFVLLSRRYLNAFAHSIYADNFRQLAAMTVVAIGREDSDDAATKLTTVMSGLDKAEQRHLYLLIARDAVVAGRFKMTELASSEAGRLSQGSAVDEARALVYFGAATIVGEHFDMGMKALTTAQPSALDRQDSALRTSAIAVAEMIRSPVKEDKRADSGVNEPDGTLADGERSIAAADELLKSFAK